MNRLYYLPNNILYNIYKYDDTYKKYFTEYILNDIILYIMKKKFKKFILNYLFIKIIKKEFSILYFDNNIILKYIKNNLIIKYGLIEIIRIINYYKNKSIYLVKNKLSHNYNNYINNIIYNMINLDKLYDLITDVYDKYKNEYDNNKYLYNKFLNEYNF